MNTQNIPAKVMTAVNGLGPSNSFPTLKSRGALSFRSRIVRDLACILDVDPQTAFWITKGKPLVIGEELHVADLEVRYIDESVCLIDAPDRDTTVSEHDLKSTAALAGFGYRIAERSEIYSGFRLQNARDLLRYAKYSPSLADRLRLLGTLDEQGSLSMSDCLRVLPGRDPVAVLASLILHGLVGVELDEALLGPETMVRRIRS